MDQIGQDDDFFPCFFLIIIFFFLFVYEWEGISILSSTCIDYFVNKYSF